MAHTGTCCTFTDGTMIEVGLGLSIEAIRRASGRSLRGSLAAQYRRRFLRLQLARDRQTVEILSSRGTLLEQMVPGAYAHIGIADLRAGA